MKDTRIRQLKRQMPISDLAGSSAYFQEMAAEGKILDEVGYLYYYFREEEPKDIRYEATVFTEYPSAELLEEYAQKGWHVVSHWELEFVFATEDMESPSLFGIDGWELEKVERTLEQLEKNKISKWDILTSVLLFLGFVYGVSKGGMDILLSKEAMRFLLPFVIAVVLYFVQKIHLQRKRARLLEDADDGYTEMDWRRNRSHHRNWMAAGVVIVLGVIYWCSGIGGKVSDLPQEISYVDLPAVRMERLAGEDFIPWGERIDPAFEGFRVTPGIDNTPRHTYQDKKRNGEVENYVTRYRSKLLGGKAVMTTQAMQSEETERTEWLETTYYSYPMEFLVERGYAKRAEKARDGGGIYGGKNLIWGDAKRTEIPAAQGNWDSLTVYQWVNAEENAEKRVILVRQDTQMMELHYRGDAALEDVLAEADKVFAAQK